MTSTIPKALLLWISCRSTNSSLIREKTTKKTENEEDTLDAFIAMGGQADTQGEVSTEKLVKVINDFQMTIDIQNLIEEIDEVGLLG